MPEFSQISQRRLFTCDPLLISLFNEVIKHMDCSILEGFRSKDDQNALFDAKRTQLKWPDSNHNKVPSLAVDVAPYPIDWKDRERFSYFAGFVKGVASQLFIPIRWGGDWDSDNQVKDNVFDDLSHYELMSL